MSLHAPSRALSTAAAWWRPVAGRLDRVASGVFILPAVVVILAFSIFPLLTSLYVSLSRLGFSQGGVELKFVGFDNYRKLLFGIDRPHPGQMEHRIEQHRGVAIREDEAVAVRPDRVGGVEAEEALPERVGDGGHRHRRSGMARVRLLDRVDRQRANRVDAELVDVLLHR